MAETIATTPLEQAVKEAGGPAKAARLCGIEPSAVSQWLSGERPLPPKHAATLEVSTGIPVEQLLPKTRWRRSPDATWPNPAGRPCIDVFVEQPAREAA